MLDLVIVGGGPAGASAAIYAARKRLRSVLVLEEWGGQSTVSTDIQNWVGTPSISGADLAAALKKHVETYAAGGTLEIRSGMRAVSLKAGNDSVVVGLSKGESLEAKALIVATGASRRQLDVPGAKEYDQKGLTYCASCDGPLFADKDVAVIGGGNAAFETALQLVAYCKNVHMLNRSTNFRADEITVAAARAHANFHIITNAVPSEVVGEQFVTGLKYKDVVSGTETLLPAEGIFVEIGMIPNTSWLGGTVELDEAGRIKVDCRSQRSSHQRVWAAGDISNALYHQNNIAVGDAIKALEDAYLFVKKEQK